MATDHPRLQPLEAPCATPMEVPNPLSEQYADLLANTRAQWQKIPEAQQSRLSNMKDTDLDAKWVTWDTTINKLDGSQLNLHVYASRETKPTLIGIRDESKGQDDSYDTDGRRNTTRIYVNRPDGTQAGSMYASFSYKDKTGFIRSETFTALGTSGRNFELNFDETGRMERSVCK